MIDQSNYSKMETYLNKSERGISYTAIKRWGFHSTKERHTLKLADTFE